MACEGSGPEELGDYGERCRIRDPMSLGDLGWTVMLGLPLTIGETVEAKPYWVKVLGAYAAAPTLLLVEVSHGLGAALELRETHPGAAVAITVATAYTAIQTLMTGYVLHCETTE